MKLRTAFAGALIALAASTGSALADTVSFPVNEPLTACGEVLQLSGVDVRTVNHRVFVDRQQLTAVAASGATYTGRMHGMLARVAAGSNYVETNHWKMTLRSDTGPDIVWTGKARLHIAAGTISGFFVSEVTCS